MYSTNIENVPSKTCPVLVIMKETFRFKKSLNNSCRRTFSSTATSGSQFLFPEGFRDYRHYYIMLGLDVGTMAPRLVVPRRFPPHTFQDTGAWRKKLAT